MKMNKSGLDERQQATRNKIGYQTFMLMTYLLLIDISLSGFDIRWIEYPTNIMIIITICLIVYLVRLILGNSHSTAGGPKRKPIFVIVLSVVLAALIIAVLVSLHGNSIIEKTAVNSNGNSIEDYSAVILFIVSTGGLIVAGIVSLVKKHSDSRRDNDSDSD